jgi:hypothetical protein
MVPVEAPVTFVRAPVNVARGEPVDPLLALNAAVKLVELYLPPFVGIVIAIVGSTVSTLNVHVFSDVFWKAPAEEL